MNTLAIETSHPNASLCLSLGDDIAYSTHWQAERNHDEYLFPALQQAFAALGENALDFILIGAGPGSYGGVRVALAAAVGIAAVKEAKTVAICSWLGLAPAGTSVISDARRGGWTLMHPNGSIEVLTANELKQQLNNGLIAATIETEDTMQHHGISVSAYGLQPTAENITRTWLSLSPAQQQKLLQTPPEPIYVRPPHITAAKRKPWEC